MKAKSTWQRKLLIALSVFLALIFTALLSVTIYVNSLLNKIPRADPTAGTLTSEQIDNIISETDPEGERPGYEKVDPEDVTLPTDPAESLEEEDHIINILLIGQDRRPGDPRGRSDSMILCTINTQKKTLVMTSFLRDMYVTLPPYNGQHYLPNRINIPYAIGGMEMLNETLEMNFGVHVDHNIEVDFSGFEDVVDLVGGVDINLTAAEANYLGNGRVAGMNHLDGKDALTYARIRSIDSDFQRTNRQRNVLVALMEKVRHMDLKQLNDLANQVLPMITTDMSNADIFFYIAEFFPILSELEVTTQYIPAEGTYYGAFIREMAVLVPNIEANRKILQETIGE